MSSNERYILRALARGVRPTVDSWDADELRSLASYHRVAPLIVRRWSDDDTPDIAELVDALSEVAAVAAVRDMHQTIALRDALAGCQDAGVRVMVLKGSAFGPWLYRDSQLRPRLDVDLWVDGWGAVDAASEALERRGFHATHQLPGRVARHAVSMERWSRGTRVALDLHARPSRRVRVSRAVGFDDTWQRSETLSFERLDVRTPSAPDALLHAALHLASHHADHHLPWIHLEDLSRLAVLLKSSDWEALEERLRVHELASAFLAATDAVERWSPGLVPDWFVDSLRSAAPDASHRFSDEGSAVLDDLELLGPVAAARYLRELAFPPADYLRRHFGTARDRPAALLWGWRLVRGLTGRVLDRT